MTIQIDTREKPHAIAGILKHFEDAGIDYFVSKLYVGDYMSLDNPYLVIDRKQNLTEVCQNVCQQHDRFRAELTRAQAHGIHIIVLVEHGQGVDSLEDVIFWQNPRLKSSPKAVTGETLYNILTTLERKYGVQFLFCDKEHTGAMIEELLGG